MALLSAGTVSAHVGVKSDVGAAIFFDFGQTSEPCEIAPCMSAPAHDYNTAYADHRGEGCSSKVHRY